MTTLRGSWQFWALTAFLFLTFLTGGGSRDDIQSLVILRPAAVLVCGLALFGLQWDHVRANRFLFAMTAAIFGLVMLHLVPLPSEIWGALPGRGIVSEIDKAAQLGTVWRPVSLVPIATWNALYSLFVPLAVLLLGVQLTREQRFQLLPLILGIGLVSGFLGLLQSIGAPGGPLYLYRVTSAGSAVGLFANRNHQADFLAALFPMLAIYAAGSTQSGETANRKMWLAISVGVVLIPLILVTGSRAGLFIGLIGLGSSVILFRRPKSITAHPPKAGKISLKVLVFGIVVVGLGALTALMSRAEAVRRLVAQDQIEDLRFRLWQPIVDMAWKYFPVGSGIGSFVEVYQVDEPYQLLSPTYLNHAHNDWIEIYLTAGLPGMLLVAIAAVAFCRRAYVRFG
jgi:O-antigen ligase